MSLYKIKPIEDFEGYWIDTSGGVWSQRWARTRQYCGLREKKKLNASIAWSGHLFVRLRKNNKYYIFRVHRLVAQAFIENPENKPCVCHIDGNPKNNLVNNLYWGSRKDNSQDMVRHGRSNRGVRNPMAKLNNEKIKLIKLLYKMFDWKQSKISKLFNIDRSEISRIVNDIRWNYIIS